MQDVEREDLGEDLLRARDDEDDAPWITSLALRASPSCVRSLARARAQVILCVCGRRCIRNMAELQKKVVVAQNHRQHGAVAQITCAAQPSRPLASRPSDGRGAGGRCDARLGGGARRPPAGDTSTVCPCE